jgi:hypothetical protein
MAGLIKRNFQYVNELLSKLYVKDIPKQALEAYRVWRF